MKKEMRNPHPSELLVSEYFNHSTTDSKLSLLTGNTSQIGISAMRCAEKNALTRSSSFKDKGEVFYVERQLSR